MSSFRFRKKTEYGLMMMGALVRDCCVVSVSELVKKGMPRAFVSRIAGDLAKSGLIDSAEGRGGGYVFKGDARKVSVFDVVEALEGDVGLVECVAHGNECPLLDKCSHRNFMKKISDDVKRILKKYRLEDIC